MRRDEADAQAREEEQDKRTQIVDSERRLKLLRGQQVDDLPANDESSLRPNRHDDHGHSRKRRKRVGEDDTDRDMRLVEEEAILQSRALATTRTTDAPLTDAQGHIDLFPSRSQHKEKKVEAEAERAKKRREHEDQYTMRFSNAAGFKQGLEAPWYSSISRNNTEVQSKDVWGNDDAGRKGREKMRADANDPLAAMKRGVKQLREVESSRKDWVAEREKEMRELDELEHSTSLGRRHRKRRRQRNDSDKLEDFHLDSSFRDRRKEDRHHKARTGRHHDGSRSGRLHVANEGRQNRRDTS